MIPIPITIITGFLGSGKTTLILNLIPQLPPGYKLALLKNEYGDVKVDSALASSAAISGVQELLNGCICCNLVGQLSDALHELASSITPDRIVIETSGSAFPATLAMEINRLARETGAYVLDGVLSVIDVENWGGYEDTSVTAKMQARYTDLIVLNKWEGVGERRVEDVEDKILALELEVQCPRARSRKGWVDKQVVFGLDARLAGAVGEIEDKTQKHDHDHDHASEVEVLSVSLGTQTGKGGSVDMEKLVEFLGDPTKDEVYRIKGILYANTPPPSDDNTAGSVESSGRRRYILNWAFGRFTFTHVPLNTAVTGDGEDEPALRLTVITARYESTKWKKQIESSGLIVLEGEEKGVLVVEKLG